MRNAVVLICLSLPVPLPTLLADDAPEDKLVQGELLEVSSGDLEKAMAIYKAIEKDEKAPESTRARALLCLARCQRKLGELEAAKKTLGELIRVHANEQEILRQAQSFLQEIEGGRAANSNFDWLKELEKSPEIQARVFDLTMDLLNNDDPKAGSARRQLRALGVIAVPVMERVLEVSRDTRQRLWLASLLVQCGRYERIGVFLDSGQELSWYNTTPEADLMQRLKSFNDEQRRGLIAAIDKHASRAETLKNRCLILLAAGDRRDVLSLVRATEEIAGQRSEAWKTVLGSSDALLRHLLIELAKDPQVADAMAERVLNPACEFAVVNDYVAALVKSSPEKLKAEHWAAYLERCAATPEWKSQSGAVRSILQILTEQGRYDVLLGLAKGQFGETVGEYFVVAHMTNTREPRIPPEAWAPVLRAARPRQSIQWLAEIQDAAIPELVGFLRNRANEEPVYWPIAHDGHGAAWAPSSAYLEAMAGMLDDKDPITVAIALEALTLAPERNPPGAGAMIEKVAKEGADARLREIAIHTLLKCFEDDPALGPPAASALFKEFQSRMDVAEIPQDYLDSQLARLSQIGGLNLPAVAAGASS
ncbi:MAG TPA: tetratricopeptide repeat protein, partial [Planctomycetota bacterium]|nr:tetratricopeptide repeat protein [Planctomycetota bacterium]